MCCCGGAQQLPVQTTSKSQNALQTLSRIRRMDKTFSPLLNLLSRNVFYKLFLPNFYQCTISPFLKKKKRVDPGCLEIRLLCKGLPRVYA